MCHAKNQHFRLLDTVHDDVLSNGKTPRADTEVIVTGAAQVGMPGKKKKSVGDGIDQVVGDVNAPLSLAT
jgi:hypothetical protein